MKKFSLAIGVLFSIIATGMFSSCGTASKAAMMPMVGNVEAVETSAEDILTCPLFKNKQRKAFDDHILERIDYPYSAERYGITGIVEAAFVVDTNGAISAVSILRSADESLGKEVVKVIGRSPKKWTPAMLNGMPMRSLMRIAVDFSDEGVMIISIDEEDKIIK